MQSSLRRRHAIGAPHGLPATLALALSLTLLATTAGAQPPPYLTQWGASGSGDGQFSPAWSLAADGDGNVFVADTYYANRVQAFDGVGTFLTKWGTSGSGPGQFQFPNSLAVDAGNTVYVTDSGNQRVEKFTRTGTYLGEWGTSGSGDGQFNGIIGIAIDPDGNVYVGDQGNHRVQKFSGAGVYLGQWGSSGSGDGQFVTLYDIACDASSNVYVTDAYGSRVQKFTSDGTFVTAWGSFGSGPGQFSFPEGIEIDAAGNVYVVDTNNSRVQMFSSDGTFLSEWGGYGSGNGQFIYPSTIGIDRAGHIFVGDNGNARIQKFGSVEPPVSMAVSLPGSFNLRSLGRWMTAYLQPPAGFDASSIDVGSIRLRGNVAGSSPVPVDPAAPTALGDENRDHVQDLMVKFPRSAVDFTLTGGEAVPVEVSGMVAGRAFSGATTLRVLRVPVTEPAPGTVLNAGTMTTVRWQTPPAIALESIALLFSMDDGASWTLVVRGIPNTGSYVWQVPAAASSQARVAVVLVEAVDESGDLVEGVMGTSQPFTIQALVGVGDVADATFALQGVTPNPGHGPLSVTFSLPDATPARLEMLDVGGRRVIARAVGALGAGRHRIALPSGLRAGVYLVRLTQASRVRAIRVTVLE